MVSVTLVYEVDGAKLLGSLSVAFFRIRVQFINLLLDLIDPLRISCLFRGLLKLNHL